MSTSTIENEKLRVTVAAHGSELVSVYDKEHNREVMWQADPAFWSRHAPVLFPNVGQYYKGTYRVGQKEYHEGQHGFARDSEFTPALQTGDSITYALVSDEHTKERYPFDFCLKVTHALSGNRLKVTWQVENTGSETMYFTIGGHPAFNIPVTETAKFSDHYLTFADDQDTLTYKLLDTSCGCVFSDSSEKMELTDHRYQLRDDMFDIDTFIFDGGQVRKAGLAYPDGRQILTVYCEGFPNFGIWSKPGAPYVCLEPWFGRCDNAGYEGSLEDKPGVTALEAGRVFEASYIIEIA